MILAGWIPGPIGTAVSVALPLLSVFAVLILLAVFLLVKRAAIPAAVAVLVCVIASAPALPALAAAPAQTSLTIASQNVHARSGSAAGSAADLLAEHPDVITLTELDAASRTAAAEILSAEYPHAYAVGTVGIWSEHPLEAGEPLSLGLGWNRALRVTVDAPSGAVRVYLVHAASVRPGAQDARDRMLEELAAIVREDPASRIVALGDFNAATTDPALRPLSDALELARPTDSVTGFTWPADLPLVKIDHVFQRGFAVSSAGTVRAGTSDHLATMTTLSPR